MTDLPPPGWYEDPSGTLRWWDGRMWTVAAGQPGQQPAAVPFASAPYGSVPPRIDAGVVLSHAWQKFTEHWQVLVGMMVVVVLVGLAGTVLALATLLPVLRSDAGSATMAASWTAYAVAIVVVSIISYVLQAGLLRAGLAITRGVAPTIGMLVQRDGLWPFLGTVVVVSIAFMVGYLMCILPGLAVLVCCAYAPFIALDRGTGPIESIRRSVELVRSRPGEVIVVLLLAGAIYYAGSLACYVGLLVSTPVAILMLAISYRLLEGEPVAP